MRLLGRLPLYEGIFSGNINVSREPGQASMTFDVDVQGEKLKIEHKKIAPDPLTESGRWIPISRRLPGRER